MMSKGMIKVICIIMAVLMVLSVGAVVLQVFASDEAAMTFVNPATGDSGSDYYVPAGIAVAAILAVVLCLVLPKLKRKDGSASASVPGVKPEKKAAPSEKTESASDLSEKGRPVIRRVGKTVDRKNDDK